MTLITKSNITNTDEFYAALLAVHQGLTEPQSHALTARLVLILANHIGDQAVLTDALILAKDRT